MDSKSHKLRRVIATRRYIESDKFRKRSGRTISINGMKKKALYRIMGLWHDDEMKTIPQPIDRLQRHGQHDCR